MYKHFYNSFMGFKLDFFKKCFYYSRAVLLVTMSPSILSFNLRELEMSLIYNVLAKLFSKWVAVLGFQSCADVSK